jgi:Leucine-rich repeat (LRR) protein
VADLQELHCGNNQLTELDVSKLSNLHSLDARWNRLSQINAATLAASCEIKVDPHVKVIEQNGKRWGTE